MAKGHQPRRGAGGQADTEQEALAWVGRLHQVLDEALAPLLARHADRLSCQPGCADCCLDDLTVYELEARWIRHHHAHLLRSAVPHPPGRCAFLDSGLRCRIYQHRPYVCRTQGLPLRWAEAGPAGGMVELRDICPLNDAGLPLQSLAAADLWTLGPVERRLEAMQRRLDGGILRRVSLRSMFQRSDPTLDPVGSGIEEGPR